MLLLTVRCQFHQRFTCSFYRSQKHKNIQLSHQYLFTILGSAGVKALHRTLMKLTPCYFNHVELVFSSINADLYVNNFDEKVNVRLFEYFIEFCRLNRNNWIKQNVWYFVKAVTFIEFNWIHWIAYYKKSL